LLISFEVALAQPETTSSGSSHTVATATILALGSWLFPYFPTLLDWGDKWCQTGKGEPMLMHHLSCEQSLMRCDQCGETLVATEVHFKL